MALNIFKIESVEVSNNASSVTFSSIPQGYTDLVLKFSTRDTDAGTASHFGIIFNGDTGANYTSLFIRGDGSGSVLSFSQTPSYIVASYQSSAGSTANSFGTGEMYIPNYTGSNQKGVSLESMSETNNALAYMNMTAGKWTGTSAITSITAKQTIGGPFVANSTFTLYGIL